MLGADDELTAFLQRPKGPGFMLLAAKWDLAADSPLPLVMLKRFRLLRT